MYVFEIRAEGIFVTFPWWLENVKSRSKIALFSNERHFEMWFPKTRTITFFWGKLSKQHKKDPILHVATSFSLKQGETRTSHGPIPHPLSLPQGVCGIQMELPKRSKSKAESFCEILAWNYAPGAAASGTAAPGAWIIWGNILSLICSRSIIWMYSAPGAYLDMLLGHCAF